MDNENQEVDTTTSETDSNDGAAVKEVATPEFSTVTDTSTPSSNHSLSRFLDVEVTITAELGRVEMPLGELVALGEGSVVELGRSVSDPVDLVAQGQRVASGEVVVIDDCFAVRITNISSVEPAA